MNARNQDLKGSAVPIRLRHGRSSRWLAVAAGILSLVAAGSDGKAAESNRIMGELTIKSLPSDLPPFLRRPDMMRDVGELAREPDRWRNAGPLFDAEHGPEHFIMLDANGTGRTGLAIADFPRTQDEYVLALNRAGTSKEKEGSLYYATILHFEQLKQDFAIYRVQQAALRTWKNRQEISWLRADMLRREWLIKRDLGLLVHFAGDVMAPLHVSIHKDGWSGPNPHNYTAKPFHMLAEGEFFLKNVTRADVERAVPPSKVCAGEVGACVAAALRQGVSYTEPMYRIATERGFDKADPQSITFMTDVTARQVGLARDLVVKAWRESVDQTLGYPPMLLKVSDVESGRVAPTYRHLHGWD